MATVILGKLDDRTMAWRDPPTEAVDTSEPDVVSLATLLADPPDPVRDGGARARVRGHDGIHPGAEGVWKDDDPRGGGGARESRTTVGGPRHRGRDRAGGL